MKRKYPEMPTQARLWELFDYFEMYNDRPLVWKVWADGTPASYRLSPRGNRLKVDGATYPLTSLIAQWHYGNVTADTAFVHINGKSSDRRISNLFAVPRAEFNKFNKQALEKRKRDNATFDQQLAAYLERIRKVRASRKDAPPSSGQMTEGAGATGMDTMARGAKDANHNVALTDQALAAQVPEHGAHRAAKRQTEVVETVTGTRYCKRCAGHRKSDGGTYLSDAINRRYWVCQSCTDSYRAVRGDSVSADAGRAQP